MGLTNAWMIVQTDVSCEIKGGEGRGSYLKHKLEDFRNTKIISPEIVVSLSHSLPRSRCFKKLKHSVVNVAAHSILTSVPFSKSSHAKYLVTS